MKEIGISETLRQNYQNYYADGDSEWRRLGALDKAENIVALCRDIPQNKVLEIGAGEGSILKRLSEIGFGEELYGIEISESGVETIRTRQIPRLVDCRVFDGYRIPYDGRAFDIAILSHVIEHVEHPRQLLYEASRVARYVFVEVPLEHTLRLSNDYVADRVGHINFYTPTTIRRLLQSSNLRVLRQIANNPSKETYLYQKGRRALIDYYVKSVLIKALPNLATGLFVYHASLLCEPVPQSKSADERRD